MTGHLNNPLPRTETVPNQVDALVMEGETFREATLASDGSYFGVPVADLDRIRESIRGAISQGKSIAIIGHRDPDPDCAGSMEGLARLVEIMDPKAKFSLHNAGTLTPNLSATGFKASSIEDLLILKENQGDQLFVILVDAPSTAIRHVSGSVDPKEMPVPDLVLDHHGGPANGNQVFRYVNPRQVGSASTIALAAIHRELAGQFREVPESAAMQRTMNLIAAGIDTDNRSQLPLMQAGDPIDQASTFANVKAEAGAVAAFDLSGGALYAEAFRRGFDAMRVHEIEGVRIGFTTLGTIRSKAEARPIIAMAAEDYVDMNPRTDQNNGVDAVCVIAESEGDIIASVRSNGTYNAEIAAKALFGEENGGGKPLAGGAQIPIEKMTLDMPTINSSNPQSISYQALPELAARVLQASKA